MKNVPELIATDGLGQKPKFRNIFEGLFFWFTFLLIQLFFNSHPRLHQEVQPIREATQKCCGALLSVLRCEEG